MNQSRQLRRSKREIGLNVTIFSFPPIYDTMIYNLELDLGTYIGT